VTVGGDGSVDVFVSPLDAGLSTSSLETRGGWEGGREKSYDGMFEGRGEV